ncbi:Ribosomal RNA small subunit methyltransferase [Trichinella spiralis]|uniref:Ribosomal RNA small subunit methyltransferase n=1 Tax=Trichinella spiralis TaxID=6334 RepID=A0ABR3KBP1_TRISP
MILRTKIHRLTILLVFIFAASCAFLSDDDTDILRKARAWIAKHRKDYSLAFSTSDDPCEVLYDTAKRQLRWIRREYRLPYLIKKNYVRVLRKMKRVAKRNIRIKRGTRRCTVLMKLFLTDSAVEFS